jgi:hypothetical protein
LPSPQRGLTSEITAADGSPNGPHAAGAAGLAAPQHETRNVIIARQTVRFTSVIYHINSVSNICRDRDCPAELYDRARLSFERVICRGALF